MTLKKAMEIEREASHAYFVNPTAENWRAYVKAREAMNKLRK